MPRKLTDEELVNLVLARFRPLIEDPTAGVTPYSKLSESFRDLDEPALSRGIKEAFYRRLVELRPAEGLKSTERSQELEREVRRVFGSLASPDRLKTVVVVKYGLDARPTADEVARDVGWSFGEWLIGSRIVNPESCIGIGPGQTVYRVSECVHERGAVPDSAIPAGDVTFASLTGRLNARVRTRRNLLADADINTVRMGMGIAGLANYRLLGLPAILPNDKKERDVLTKGTWMRSDSPPPKLNYALVGFGPFDNMFEDLSALIKQEDPLTKELDFLKQLAGNLSEIRGAGGVLPFTPIGDISGQLILIEPPPNARLTEAQNKILNEMPARLKQVQSRILTVDAATLRDTPLWVVGGGAPKAHILRTVLTSYTVDTLVTDSTCANALLHDYAK